MKEKKKSIDEPIIEDSKIEEKTGVVTAELLNIREQADISSNVVKVIPVNTVVKIVGKIKNGFYPVNVNDISGFVKKDFIKVEE